MNHPPSAWQQAKAFFSAPFWRGMAEGAAIGVPTAVVVWAIFAVIPAAIMPAAIAGFTGLPVQFFFCTVFGAASSAVMGGLQAVKSLNSPSVSEPASSPISTHRRDIAEDLNEHATAIPTPDAPSTHLTSPRIRQILEAGPATTHHETLATQAQQHTSHTLH